MDTRISRVFIIDMFRGSISIWLFIPIRILQHADAKMEKLINMQTNRNLYTLH